MTSSSIVLDLHDDPATESLRSRASSIITTTTKFSLETLSQDDHSSIVAIRERQLPNFASRPRSLLSMTSIARPAPPYNATLDSTLLLPTHHNGDFLPPPSPPCEILAASEPTSVSEALPPSPSVASESATASPNGDSPIDPDNPRAQIITYYNHVVHTLDQNYTASLEALRAQHASALAATRHSIDAAYRAQWKAKNREIEIIKQEAAREIGDMEKACEVKALQMEKAVLEQREEKVREMAAAVQKARHEVEDLWERRWAERMSVEGEEKRRTEREHLEQMERVMGEFRRMEEGEKAGESGRNRRDTDEEADVDLANLESLR